MLFLSTVLSFFGCSKPPPPLAAATAPPAVQLDVAKLREFLNLDLRVLYGQQFTDFEEHIASRLPKVAGFDSYWTLWHIKTPAHNERFVLFLGYPLSQTPGSSAALIYMIDGENGTLRSSTKLDVGYRLSMVSANCEYSPEAKDYIIRIETFPDDGGPNICRQIYGFEQDKPVPLWAENCDGKRIESHRWP